MRKSLLLVGALAGALASAACGDDPASPATGTPLSAAEAEALALEFDAHGIELLDAEMAASEGEVAVSPSLAPVGPSLDLIVTEIEFTRTRSCPLGGEVVLAGTMLRERDTEAGSLRVTFEADRTPDACTYAIPVGTISITGNPNIHIEGERFRVNGVPVGLQVTTHVGAFSWEKSEGSHGTCVVEITSTLDPETRTRSVTGTFCGRVIDRTVTWEVDARA